MKRSSIFAAISALILVLGIVGIRLWWVYGDPGEAFAFSVLSITLVWPVCCLIAAFFWLLSGYRQMYYILAMIPVGIIESVVSMQKDLGLVITGIVGAVVPAALVFAVGNTVNEKYFDGKSRETQRKNAWICAAVILVCILLALMLYRAYLVINFGGQPISIDIPYSIARCRG